MATKYHAEWIDKHQFAFLCYHCDDYHYHGNNDDFINNRTETRCSHCLDLKQIEVDITSLTERRLYGKDKTLYNKHLNSA